MFRILATALLLGTASGQIFFNSTNTTMNEQACNRGAFLTGGAGVIDFASNQSRYHYCRWYFNVPEGKLLNFTFRTFNVPCTSGNLRISYSPYKGSTYYCDDNRPRDFISLTEQVNIYLTAYGNFPSFSLSWQTIDGCTNGSFRCWNGKCIDLALQCNQMRDCEDDSDEITCAQNSTSFEQCGKTASAPGFSWNPRIVGGATSNRGAWPWYVSIFRFSLYSSSGQDCRGTIIHKDWVLTSASCVHGSCEDNLRVYHSYSWSTSTYRVADIIVHDQYEPLNTLAGYDIALIRVVGGFTFFQYLRPVCLGNYGSSPGYAPPSGQICIAVGKPHTYDSRYTAHHVRLPILDSATCLAEYNKLRTLQGVANATSIPGGQICAGMLSEVAGTCDGDEGGALLCLVGESAWYQVGVSSFRLCNGERHASFYTDVSAFSTWITESIATRGLSCGHEITGTSGRLSSPNYPLRAPTNIQCQWTILAPSNTVLVIRFNDFELPSTSTCSDAYLAMYDGNSTSSELVFNQLHCGSVAPRPFEASSNALTAVYRNHLRASKGFSLEWSTEAKCDASTQFRCWSGSCIPIAQRCDSSTNCADKSDEIECSRATSNASECGKQAIAPEFKWSPRIIGGSEVVPHSFPWQVMLSPTYDPYDPFCSGSILNRKWVLTAAHCVRHRSASSIFLTAGKHNSTMAESNEHRLRACEIHIHHNYSSFWNDVALIRVRGEFIFNDYVRPICIQPLGESTLDPPALTQCVATGWGRQTLNNYETTTELRQGVLELLTKETCDKAYRQTTRRTTPMPESQLCASDQPGLSVCHGDSGGPLVCLVGSNVWYQVGITSYGRNCGELPSFFMRVSSYAQWISETMTRNGDGNRTCESVCGTSSLTTRNGTLLSPNYPFAIPSYTACRWTINAPDGLVIYLKVVEFSLGSYYCSSNYLELYDGGVQQGVRHCSTSTMKSFQTKTNRLAIVLTTGSYVPSYSQFRFDWRSGVSLCQQSNYTNTTEGTLTSPFYPDPYPPGLDCTWQISVPENKVIVIQFHDFDVVTSYSSSCSYDYMQVWDGSETYTGRRLCGNLVPGDFAALNNVVTIQFVSTYSFTHFRRGFHITWHTTDRCAANEYSCWNGSCIPEAMHCDLNDDCMDNSDEIECAHNTSSTIECGKLAVAPQFTWDQRIVGGNEAVPGSWPWQVGMTRYAHGVTFCGGSIISERYVLTAAHCVDDVGRTYWIVAGRHNRTGSPGEVAVIVDVVIIHQNYRVFYDGFDIALLRLNRSLVFSDTIRPVCLPSNTSDFNVKEGTVCVATGFGDLEYRGDNPSALYQVRLPIVSNARCAVFYLNASSAEIFGSNICAGDPERGGISSCQGDSGGPLQCYVSNTWYVFGVTSYGVRCAAPKFPGVYTRVSWFSDWIQAVQNLQVDECNATTLFTTTRGNFSSPGYPIYFPGKLNCSWTISAPENHLIEITFLGFQLPLSYRCRLAALAVYDGDSLLFGESRCGLHSPGNFVSSSNNVTFKFAAVEAASSGFHVSWKFEKKCKSDQFGCWDGSQCISITKACDQTRDCPDDSDEIECPQPSTNFSECGKTSVSPGFTWHERIVGGSRPRNGTWPWYAIILRRGYPMCSGSIIASSFVLTTGSCFYYSSVTYWTVTSGANDTVHAVASIIYHPDYHFYGDENDLAVVRLSQPFEFSEALRPVCLPASDAKLTVGEICVALGTGNTGRSSSNGVHHVRLPIVDSTRCLANLGYNASSLFCAGYYEERQSGTCYGDEGGPLVCLVGENAWTQVGVAAQSTTCSFPGFPSVFVKVSSYTGWINEVLSQNYSVAPIENSTCGASRFTAASGVVTSPGYPLNYDNNLDCEYIITAPDNMAIEVTFVDFHLEDHPRCVWDYLEVYDGAELYTGKRFCGDQLPRSFAAFSNSVRIVFHSDSIITAQGFMITYTTSVRCSDSQFTCWDGACIPGDRRCDRVSDCTNGDDEIECVQGTGVEEHCGTVDESPTFTWDPRIVGGSVATPGSYPWMAMLTDSSGDLLCGGSIITDNAVLTAAHCIASNTSRIMVHVGRHSINESSGPGVQSFTVNEIRSHENYVSSFSGNDIALLKINGTIHFTSSVKPVCIPPSSQGRFQIPENARCIATGWGTLGRGVVPDELYQVRLPIVSQAECNSSYLGQVLDSQICAGNLRKGGVDACQGDSGGPLVCLVGQSSWYQYGVTSFGDGCGEIGKPGVYTRVSSFYQWIVDNILSDLPQPYTGAAQHQPETTTPFNAAGSTTPPRVSEETSVSHVLPDHYTSTPSTDRPNSQTTTGLHHRSVETITDTIVTTNSTTATNSTDSSTSGAIACADKPKFFLSMILMAVIIQNHVT